MKVLVTGATGFIGRALSPVLARAGHEVRLALRGPDPGSAAEGDRVVVGDIGPGTDWRGALRGVDAVIHAAARVHVMRETAAEPLAAFRSVNVAGTERLARAAIAAGIGRFVFLSSIGAAVAESLADDPGARSATDYQQSKWEAERSLSRVSGDTGMTCTVLRPPLVYGPDAPGHFGLLMTAVRRGLPLPFASIRNRRTLLYRGNLASAVVACLTRTPAVAGVFALSDGEVVSVPELVRRLATAMGRPARLLPCPLPLLRLAGHLTGRSAALEGLLGDLVVDNGAISKRLGWQPAYTMKAALAETVASQNR